MIQLSAQELGVDVQGSNAEDLVTSELEAHDLRCEPFAKPEMRAGKTPDRRIYCGENFAFFLEVKEIEDIVTHSLGDSILDRIANDIHKAIKQFDAVNPECEHPNVLAFVNRNSACSVLDLEEAVTGHRRYENGYHPTGLRWSEGRIREEKHRVHLFMWFHSPNAIQFRFNFMDKRHLRQLARYFRIDPDSIPDIATYLHI